MRFNLGVLFCLMMAVCMGAWSVEAPTEAERSAVPEDINDRFLDPDADPEDWKDRFEVESREIFSSRKKIVEALHLNPGDRVADVGAGTGLFSALFSKAVEGEGKVYAVDISPTLIQFMRKRFQGEEWDNVEVIFSKEDSAELPENSVDHVFICDTYHHFEFHEPMLESIHRALAPGGRLVVIDFERIPGVSSEWILGHVRAGKETFKSEIEEAGFEFVEEVEVEGLEENYFLRFVKPETP